MMECEFDNEQQLCEEESLARTRLSFEVAAAVDQLVATLPPEDTRPGNVAPLEPIAFDPACSVRGRVALFYADDFMHANRERTVYYVRPRTRKILDALGVSYSIADPRKQSGPLG
jgi:hypothetical protein